MKDFSNLLDFRKRYLHIDVHKFFLSPPPISPQAHLPRLSRSGRMQGLVVRSSSSERLNDGGIPPSLVRSGSVAEVAWMVAKTQRHLQSLKKLSDKTTFCSLPRFISFSPRTATTSSSHTSSLSQIATTMMSTLIIKMTCICLISTTFYFPNNMQD